MARELPKIYEPQQVEDRIYKMWEEGGYFKPQGKADAKPFTIVMPPPNVTGQMADKIRNVLDALEIPLLVKNNTNQIFPILPNATLAELEKNFTFTEQERISESHRAVRFCTSWATKPENVDALCAELERIHKNFIGN